MPSATLPAGCGGTVDLASGAEVRLTVETSAQEFTVTSSFGRVEGKDRSYTVRVERKRDFLITVSAPGYETCNVPVLTADLASGSCEKIARLTEEKKITVTLRVAGAQGQVTAACGGLELHYPAVAY